MLTLLYEPVETGQSGDMVGKVAYLNGSDAAITSIALGRQRDPRCRQAPTGRDLPARYAVRVHYAVSHDGYVSVDTVEVSFDQPRPSYWSVFFDRRHQRVGTRQSAQGHFTYHFLTEECLMGIARVLERHEEKRVIARLAARGPDAFPDVEEEALAAELSYGPPIMPVDIDEEQGEDR